MVVGSVGSGTEIFIERKSFSDFYQSVVDKRLQNQVGAMLEAAKGDRSRVYVILEGDVGLLEKMALCNKTMKERFSVPGVTYRKIAEQVVYQHWADLQFKQGISVVRTQDVFETFRVIKELAKAHENQSTASILK